MAETAITVLELAENVASGDEPVGIVATTPSDGWSIPVTKNALMFRLLADASGDTVTFKAGTNPPAMRAGLGDLAITLAADDVKFVAVETARFMRADGTILAVCTDAGTTLQAIMLPPGVTAG